MNIDKAIALQLQIEETLRNNNRIEHADAIKIGMSASERLRYARLHPAYDFHRPLPGEN